jgi:hypothetical protein
MVRSRTQRRAPAVPATHGAFWFTQICVGLVLRPALGLIVAALCVADHAAMSQEPPARAQRSGGDAAPESTAPAPRRVAATSSDSDVASVRAETDERLKALTGPPLPDSTTSAGAAASAKSSAPAAVGTATSARRTESSGAASGPPTALDAAAKPLRDLLQERLRRLEEYDTLSLALQKVTNPQPSPETQTEEVKTEYRSIKKILDAAANSREALLPASFRALSKSATGAISPEIKDALASTAEELKEWKSKLETVKAEKARLESAQTARRGDRDKQFQKVSNLEVKGGEYEAAAADAQNATARRLADERLLNFKWETRVETLRLKLIESQLVLDVKLTNLYGEQTKLFWAHMQLVERTLEQMRTRYQVASEKYEHALASAAAKEESKAQSSQDPIEQFHARRTAELLVLETLVLKNEQALATSPSPSLEEERTKADRADADFARIKELLDDGKVSRLDAIRLNNEFRRIGPERGRLVKDEMAKVEAQLQFYENALTTVEIELLQDSTRDSFDRDLLQERLPAQHKAAGKAMLDEFEDKHRALLHRRRIALEQLCDRASHTLEQVSRRLSILDEEYGFIRTHIFWVRDCDPVGLETLAQGAHEFDSLIRGLVRMARETGDPTRWGRPSAEFLAIALAALAVPLGLLRLSRVFAARIERHLPVPPPSTASIELRPIDSR